MQGCKTLTLPTSDSSGFFKRANMKMHRYIVINGRIIMSCLMQGCDTFTISTAVASNLFNVPFTIDAAGEFEVAARKNGAYDEPAEDEPVRPFTLPTNGAFPPQVCGTAWFLRLCHGSTCGGG